MDEVEQCPLYDHEPPQVIKSVEFEWTSWFCRRNCQKWPWTWRTSTIFVEYVLVEKIWPQTEIKNVAKKNFKVLKTVSLAINEKIVIHSVWVIRNTVKEQLVAFLIWVTDLN